MTRTSNCSSYKTPVWRSFFYGGIAHGLEVSTIGHVFDRIKVYSESRGKSVGLHKTFGKIITTGGYKCLYKGLRWNILLSVFRGSAGGALDNFSNRSVEHLIPYSEGKSLIYPVAVGLTTATVVGSLIISPLERLKTLEMTSNIGENGDRFQFMRKLKKEPRFFFVGLPSVLLWQSVTQVSYLYFYNMYRSRFEDYRASTNTLISNVDKIGIAALTGGSVCVINSPIDFYKTHRQMSDSLPKGTTTIENIKYLITKFGVRSFYSNFSTKLLRSSMSCIIIISPVASEIPFLIQKPFP
jgi:hypothetical protein